MTDTIRKAFEGWCSTVLAHYQPTDDATVNRRDWKVWQAATLTAKIPLEKRIAELESQLEAVGAGGVGVMIPVQREKLLSNAGIAQAMGFDDEAADLLHQASSLQPAPAVVGPENDNEAMLAAWEVLKPGLNTAGWTVGDVCNYRGFFAWGWEARKRYDTPKPQQIAEPASQWISVNERLPVPGKPVLAFYKNSLGNGRTTRAHHAPLHTIDASHWDDGDPDETEDGVFEPEGWWEDGVESVQLEAINDLVTHWMPLPPPPAAQKEQS